MSAAEAALEELLAALLHRKAQAGDASKAFPQGVRRDREDRQDEAAGGDRPNQIVAEVERGAIKVAGCYKLKIVEFPAGTELSNIGNTDFAAPPNVQPTAATNSSVRQGSLEASNVNPVSSMIQLVEAQRSAEMMQRALTMFNSEMDKTASQDLPKVG